MVIKIYSIYDEKAEAYSRPYYSSHHGEAIRAFQDAVTEQGSRFGKHPADYKLYCIGEYDDNTGCIKGVTNPTYLASATDYVKTEEVLNGKVKD